MPRQSRLLTVSFAALGLMTISGCFLMGPVEEVIVPLPIGDATARVQVWGATMSEGRFELLVDTPRGSIRRTLWEDWGPAQRTSLYLTPENWLVVIGGGGTSAMIDVNPRSAPRAITYPEHRRTDDRSWTYLGAVDRLVDHLVFYRPVDQRECVPLYGEGSSPYRKSHQAQHSCGVQSPPWSAHHADARPFDPPEP